MKKIKVAPTRNFWVYILLGALSFLAALLFAPFWQSVDVPWASLGRSVLDLLIAACLFVYLFTFLLKKLLRGGNSALLVLLVLEFSCLFLIAVGCILKQFRVINISGACAILGLCLICRGSVEIFRAYYYRGGNSRPYPVWWLAVSLGMVILGTYCVAKPLFSDNIVLWLFVVLLLVLSVVLITYGVACRPEPKKSEKQKNEKSATEKSEKPAARKSEPKTKAK